MPQLAQEHLHRQYKAETRSLHQGMSPWLQVRPAPGFSYERQLSGSSQDSSTLGGGDQNDFLSLSSGQRSRLSSISQSSVSGHRSALSSARSDVSVRLTSITPTHYGSPKSMSLMGSQSPTQISKMEKRTMDRRIQSLLHWTCVWESEERQLKQASYTGTQSQSLGQKQGLSESISLLTIIVRKVILRKSHLCDQLTAILSRVSIFISIILNDQWVKLLMD